MFAVQRPEGFQFVEPVEAQPLSNETPEGVSEIYIGDSVNYKIYLYNEESGQLTIHLNDECVIHYVPGIGRRIYNLTGPTPQVEIENGRIDCNKSMNFMLAQDAILSKLARTFFKTPTGEIIGLLKGAPTKILYNNVGWDTFAYDNAGTRKIDFAAIHDFALDIDTIALGSDNSISVTLKAAYRTNKFVQYALQEALRH